MDIQKAFDNAWHNGIIFKLITIIKESIQAINITSCMLQFADDTTLMPHRKTLTGTIDRLRKRNQ